MMSNENLSLFFVNRVSAQSISILKINYSNVTCDLSLPCIRLFENREKCSQGTSCNVECRLMALQMLTVECRLHGIIYLQFWYL